MTRLAFRILVAVLLVASVVGAAGRTPARVEADAGFGSFALSATAPGVEATEDRADAVAHPEGQASIPETSVLLSTGPVAYALSTVAWPGATAGNGGALVGVAMPSSVGGVAPIPDAVRQAALQFAPLLNFPIRAEAQNGQHPDATFDLPGTTLVSHADDQKADATAALQGAEQKGGLVLGNVSSTSGVKLEGSTGTSEATSVLHDLSLGGGVVKIGSVKSVARAVTDGAKAKTEGSTTVADLTIGGQRAYVDQSGVHAGEPGQPVNAVANQILQQALSGAGMRILMSAPTSSIEGAKGSYNAGSLLVFWTAPGSPSTFTYSLGGARVSVDATPGFDSAVAGVGDVTGVTGLGDTAALPAPVASSGAPPLSLGDALAPATPVASTRRAATKVNPGPSVTPAALQPIANVFDGNPASWVLIALMAAAALGALGRRLAVDLADGAAAACPLERGRRT